jgi:hypothetical protein
MNYTWREMRLTKAHQENMLQEAEQARLVKVALAGRPRPGLAVRLYGPLLAWTGRLLAQWGARLEARYAQAAQAHRRAEEYPSVGMKHLPAGR